MSLSYFPPALRLSCLPALAACTALTVEYRTLGSAFCGPDSGCSLLRRTDIAYLWGALGMTLPEAGLLAFAALFAVSLTRATVVAAAMSVVAGVAALFLLGSQAFGVKVFCWLCVIVDTSALVGAAFSGAYLVRRRSVAPEGAAPSRAHRALRPWAWAALGAVATLAPVAWLYVKPAPDVPAPVRAYYRPGKINVIEFADFECPFCRRLHHELKELLAPYGERVHFVRLNMPLERHPAARGAALAAICAEPSGHGDELAEFMFSSEELSPARIRAEAGRLGIPLAAFDACLVAPATLERLERESRILRDVGFQGLPTTYIGSTRIVGARAPEVFADALERAADDGRELGVPAWAYLLIVAGVAGLIVRAGRGTNVRPVESVTS